MATSSFQAKDLILGYPNPYPDYNHLPMDYPVPSTGFELSDYLVPEAGVPEEVSTATNIGGGGGGGGCHLQNPILPENSSYNSVGNSGNVATSGDLETLAAQKCKSGMKRTKGNVGCRVAFRTKSKLEIMDDGFNWRKYGKKSIKSSPNPRNYYRCKIAGCNVKKRVERDREDSSYVITTYEGIHNHESPCVVYYNQVPLMVPSGWTLQASHSST